jgi:hypothetical protein
MRRRRHNMFSHTKKENRESNYFILTTHYLFLSLYYLMRNDPEVDFNYLPPAFT